MIIIATPEQAESLLGNEDCAGCATLQHDLSYHDMTLWLPATTRDQYRVSEDIELRSRSHERHVSDDESIINSTAQPRVGAVRVGEPIPVFSTQPCSRPDHDGDCIEFMRWNDRPHELALWTPDQEHFTDITSPHRVLWADAWDDAEWAFPVSKRIRS